MKYEIKIIYKPTKEVVSTELFDNIPDALHFLEKMAETDKELYPTSFEYYLKGVK